MFKRFMFAVALTAVAAIASGVLQEKMFDVEKDPIYYEACIYPASPEHNCCPEHAELHKQKEKKIRILWDSAVVINGIICLIAGSIVCDAANKKK